MENKISLGSISSGTMRKEDLIPIFIDEILYHDKSNITALEIQMRLNRDNYFDSEDSDYDLESLFDELNNLCDIPYAYFGNHSGDSSDYGFWISEELQYDFEGLKVDDTGNVPEDYNGEVLHINDHGNVTLYVANHGELTEVWGIV